MSIALTLLLQASSRVAENRAETYQCKDGKDHIEFIRAVSQSMRPMEMIVSAGGDISGSQYLIVQTDHRISVPGLDVEDKQGSTTTTYYQTGNGRACSRQLTTDNCPQLDPMLGIFRARSYAIMHVRSELRGKTPAHTSSAWLRVRDADGNLTEISSQWDHPLVTDANSLFNGIRPCIADLTRRLYDP